MVQRTHHIIQHMAEQDDIQRIDVIYVKNDQDGIVAFQQDGKINYFGIRTTPAWKYGFGHISNPIKMFLRFNRINKQKYDYIVAESPWGGIVGVLLKKIGKAPIFIYEDMDYFSGFYTISKFRNRVIKILEHLSIRNADKIITVGHELKKIRMSINRNIEVIPNGVNFNLFLKASEKPEHPPTMIYMGKIDDWAGVELPILAMPELIKAVPDLKYVVLGEGGYEQKLRKLVKDMGLEGHVDFLGLKPYSELPIYLQKADIGIATFKPIDLMKYAFTLKVIEYGAAGLPVIATRIGETKRYVEENQTGLLISYSREEFINAAMQLFGNKELYKKLALNGINKAKQMSWESILNRRYQSINRYISEHTSQITFHE
ncbi:MAG: hypothetical protein PWP07_2277 [Epulopiscium sp.]|nr:hypothetical protein [Candidatus Epulonipiscium sp.]